MESDIYEKLRTEFKKLVLSGNLLEGEISIDAKTLSPEEAIGNPERDDFPLLKGKERLMQAEFMGNRGQAFSDMYGTYRGRLRDVLETELTNNYRRAVFIASLNAVARRLGIAERTVHCRNEGMKECATVAAQMASVEKIAFFGLQPALIDSCSKKCDVMILDLDRDNIGKTKFGTEVLDGAVRENLTNATQWCDFVFATGSSVVNATIAGILGTAAQYNRRVVFYGTTIAAAAVLLDLERFCPRAT